MADLVIADGGRRAAVSASWRPSERLPWAGHTARHAMARGLRADQGATRRRWSSSTPACRPSSSSRSCGIATRTASPSRCITARSTSASAARSRTRWRRGGSGRSSAPRRSISASTGAMSISSSMSARRRAPRRLTQRIGRANHRLDEPSRGGAGADQPLRGARMQGRRRRRLCRRAGHAGRAHRRARRARPACRSASACARALPRRRALRRGHLGRALCRARPRRPSTTSSPSSRPAAMRCEL